MLLQRTTLHDLAPTFAGELRLFFIKQQPVHCSNNSGSLVAAHGSPVAARGSRWPLGLLSGRSIPWGPLADMAKGVINVAFA